MTLPHTIFLTVGTSNSGKTYFCENVLLPQLKNYKKQFELRVPNHNINIQYISSNKIRKELFGEEPDRNNRKFSSANLTIYSYLFAKLEAITDYPINSEFIVLETTGLSEDFRERVVELAKKKNYNVEVLLFDFKDNNTFYEFTENEREKKNISKQVSKLKREVLRTLKKNKYSDIHKIQNRNYDNFSLNLNVESYSQHFLNISENYIVIGDIHECIEEFKELIQLNGFKINSKDEIQGDKKIILIGDLIDKGSKTKEIIEFISNNLNKFIVVRGNHENFVYKYLNGDLEKFKEDMQEVIKENFTSIFTLQKNKELYNKFLKIYNNSLEFYIYSLPEKNIIFTHAPCKNKYLGKMSISSLKAQRNFRFTKEQRAEGEQEKQLEFLKEEANYSHPLHIFGHYPVLEPVKIKNKIAIDTGCIHGGKITSYDLQKDKFLSVKFKNLQTVYPNSLKELFKNNENFIGGDFNITDYDKRRLKICIENKVNFISGTMSPSNKNIEDYSLESLKEGLNYFKNNGVEEVILEPKFMGSRANFYLFEDPEKSYFISRKGFKIGIENWKKSFYKIHKIFLDKFQTSFKRDLEMILLDGELLPWSLIGKGLIEKQFDTNKEAISTELKFLKENSYFENLEKLEENFENSGFSRDLELSKKALKEKYGELNYKNYSIFNQIKKNLLNFKDEQNLIEIFSNQLEIYGAEAKEGNIEYQCFDILKKCYKNGEEDILERKNNIEIFKVVSNQKYCVFNFEKDSYIKAEEFYKNLTEIKNMEGVVIKPNVNKENVLPFLKVRNERYLTLVYGYDYTKSSKYERLIKQKDIRRKVKTSLKEYQVGQELLKIPYSGINTENNKYKNLILTMISEQNKEQTLDPRL